MFLLSTQNNLYIILSSYVEEHVKKKKKSQVKSEFHVFGWFPGLQNLDVFWEIFVELVWKLFSGRNNSLKAPVFLFSNSLPYDLEEFRELRALISWVLG